MKGIKIHITTLLLTCTTCLLGQMFDMQENYVFFSGSGGGVFFNHDQQDEINIGSGYGITLGYSSLIKESLSFNIEAGINSLDAPLIYFDEIISTPQQKIDNDNNSPAEFSEYTLNTTFNEYSEHLKLSSFQLSPSITYTHDYGIYTTVGFNFNFPISSEVSIETKVTHEASYDWTEDILKDIPEHGLVTLEDKTSTENLDFGFNSSINLKAGKEFVLRRSRSQTDKIKIGIVLNYIFTDITPRESGNTTDDYTINDDLSNIQIYSRLNDENFDSPVNAFYFGLEVSYWIKLKSNKKQQKSDGNFLW